MVEISKQYITRNDVDTFKREIMESTVLVRLEVAATIMDCSPRKVERLIKDGRLRCYNESMNRGLRVMASELKQYVKSIQIDHQEWFK
jgi:hypothetical protein